MDALEEQLWKDYKAGEADGNGLAYRNKLILTYLPFVKNTAKKVLSGYSGNSIEEEDLVSAGVLELPNLIREFDPSRGFEFSTHAGKRLVGSMLDCLRRLDPETRGAKLNRDTLDDFEYEVACEIGHSPSFDELASGIGRKELEGAREDYRIYIQTKDRLEQELGEEPRRLDVEVALKQGKYTSQVAKNYTLYRDALIRLKAQGVPEPSDEDLARGMGTSLLEKWTNNLPLGTISTETPLGNLTDNSGNPVTLESDRAFGDFKTSEPSARQQEINFFRLVTRGLNDKERLTIVLYYQDNRKMKEIAKELDLSESRVSYMHTEIIERTQAKIRRGDLKIEDLVK